MSADDEVKIGCYPKSVSDYDRPDNARFLVHNAARYY